jgi:S-DNA-T family DNA segregation ATPase FtsK/SpoIIIE
MRRILDEKHSINKFILDRLYLSAQDCLKFVERGNLRLWECNVNHTDFLSVRLGLGDIPSPNPIKAPKEKFTLSDDTLVDEVYRIRDDFRLLKNVPVLLSLNDHRLVGVVSDAQSKIDNIVRCLAARLAATHSYADLKMVFIGGGMEYARWFPHAWSEDGAIRMVADDTLSAGEVLSHLTKIVRNRLPDEEKKDKARALPHYIIFVTDPTLIAGDPMAKYINNPTEEIGVSAVLAYGEIGMLPSNVTVLVRQDSEFSGLCSLSSEFDDRSGVAFDTVDGDDFMAFARDLSGYRVREEHGAGAIPGMISFLDMYRVSDVHELNIARNWLENRTFESMKAMIGYRNAETPLYLDIHEKYHGPHGLVAGTTGSGKSETLQTYILSLGVSFDPREISFILIDYKGGGMAKSFDGMPHVVGIITNLGGNQTNRALASINSEIRRRQSVFNLYGVKHIDEYISLFRAEKASDPMPHLLIISDEFAELKKEQPEFVRELVSAARVGRSLGIHLILATQKPSGSVDDEIWSNTNFRLCLRVQGKQDSQDMLKRPDAAYIDAQYRGRGYMQVGNDEIFELFQSGWSGAEYEPEIPFAERSRNDVRMINLWGHSETRLKAKKQAEEGVEKLPQLRAVVEYIAEVAESRGISAISDIWLPPLPSRIALANRPESGTRDGRRGFSVPIGLADNPMGQKQFWAEYDIVERGSLVIAGSGGSGRTTLLQTLLFGLAKGYSPKQLNLYIVDFNSRVLGSFSLLPHCGGIIYDSDDPGKTDKLMMLLTRELAGRVVKFSAAGVGTYREYSRLFDDLPAIVVAIDGYAAFTENNEKLQDALVQLTRQSASYGIYLVLTCTNSGDIRSRVRQNIPSGIGIQLNDRFEYEDILGQRPQLLADSNIAGRGLAVCDTGEDVQEALEIQFALAIDAPDSAALNAGIREEFERIAKDWDGESAPGIPTVPGDMSFANLLKLPDIAGKSASGRYLPVGYDLAEVRPVYADLARTFCFSIGGTPRSGKTTTLKALAKMAQAKGFGTTVFGGKDMEKFAGDNGMAYISDTEGLYSFMENTIMPEFKDRNEAKVAFVQGGSEDYDAYFASQPKLCLFINDMTAFCDAIYNSERDMKGFAEQVFKHGAEHMIYFFACVTGNDISGPQGLSDIMRRFIGYKEGLHLGGALDSQRIFEFDVPILQRDRRLAVGTGHIIDGGATRQIAVVSV